jgi:hypothetical protein
VNNHYLPQFLIREWAGPDGRVEVLRFVSATGEAVAGRRSPRSIGCEEDLYAYRTVRSEDRHLPETRFFTPHIDTPAAEAMQVMLKGGVGALNSLQRRAWAQFLVSLAPRTPDGIAKGEGIIASTLDLDPAEYDALRGPNDPATLSEWADQNVPGRIRDTSIETTIKVMVDPTKVKRTYDADWWTRTFPDHDLVLSDRPLLSHPTASAPNGYPLLHDSWRIVLPLGPHKLFCAGTDGKWRAHMRRLEPGKIVHWVNFESVNRSQEFVYARDRTVLSDVEPQFRALHHAREDREPV